ncbi:MAG: type II secretion system protein [Patescibacteria group bacterium]
MRKKTTGFTLIELLVTTSIIGIIMSVGLVIYQGGKQKAKDARRREDLLTIQKAMEQYFVIEGDYPVGCPVVGTSFSTTDDVLLDATPDDPDSPTKSYTGTCDPDYYCYSAELDDDTGNCAGCSCAGDACSFADGTDSFCVKHMQ